MARLARVVNLIVKNIILADDPADYPQYVDVTNIDCGVGWIDNEDGTFSAPTPTVNLYERIAPRSFQARLTDSEYKAIKKKTIKANDRFMSDTEDSNDVIYVRADETLSLAKWVDVTNPQTEQFIDFYIAMGDIDPARKATLLALGSEEEKYE